MAMNGINLVYATTGMEYIFNKVSALIFLSGKNERYIFFVWLLYSIWINNSLSNCLYINDASKRFKSPLVTLVEMEFRSNCSRLFLMIYKFHQFN